MLGTNDTKARFAAPASDIAHGVRRLAKAVLGSCAGPRSGPPKLLLLAPPPLGKLDKLAALFAGGAEKSEQFAELYKNLAAELGCAFFDVGSVVTTSDLDGVHWSKEEHKALAEALVPVVREMLESTVPSSYPSDT